MIRYKKCVTKIAGIKVLVEKNKFAGSLLKDKISMNIRSYH